MTIKKTYYFHSAVVNNILTAVKKGKTSICLSLDLNLSERKWPIQNNTLLLDQDTGIDIKTLLPVSSSKNKIFMYQNKALHPIEIRSDGYYKLVPTASAPTLEINGIKMHRSKDIDPLTDAKLKTQLVVKNNDTVLDTCGGLGYSAAFCLKAGAKKVISTEKSLSVIKIRNLNPWFDALEDNRLEMVHADITREIETFEKNRFDSVIHDPPRFTSATGDLYGRKFYGNLYSVMAQDSHLFHYTGSPRKIKQQDTFIKNTIKRLEQSRFKDIVFNETLKIKEPKKAVNKNDFMNHFSPCLPQDPGRLPIISIVVADKTRLCGYRTYLPWIMETLHKKGVHPHQVQFFIAYGTHAKQSDETCLNVYGDIYKTYPFIHHDCRDKRLFTSLGTTRRGTEILVRKDLLESDLIITFGALSHHYFAGFGGGRKLLFPGLGYQSSIYQNHGLFLDRKIKKLAKGCAPGKLEKNPVAADLKEIDDAVKNQRISVHGILDSKGTVCDLIVGRSYADFLKACSRLDSFYTAPDKNQYELVLASCGGFPKDINFIQAHKAINNAAMFVKDKGSLIVLAECMDGIGSDTFIEYFSSQGFNNAFDVLKENYRGNGGTALSMMTKTGRINIFLKTALDVKTCNKIGVKKIDTDEIIQHIKVSGPDIACIKNASLLIK